MNVYDLVRKEQIDVPFPACNGYHQVFSFRNKAQMSEARRPPHKVHQTVTTKATPWDSWLNLAQVQLGTFPASPDLASRCRRLITSAGTCPSP